MIIEQDARPGAALTVDKPDLGPGQVFQAFDTFGIPTPDHQTLIPPHERDHFDGDVRHVLTDVGNVVFTRFWVEEM